MIIKDEKNVNTIMGATLWYNFKQCLHGHHPCQYILGIFQWWFKKKKISIGVYIY